MSIDHLHRRIDTMMQQLRAYKIKAEPRKIALKWHLFTLIEQDQLAALLAPIDYSMDNAHQLTDEQLDQLRTWLQLHEALDQDDTAAAERYRQRLAVSLEQVLAAFLAIPEQDVPDFKDAPHIEIEGVHYTLYRTMYRATRDRIERELARGKLLTSSIDDVRMWVEAYAS